VAPEHDGLVEGTHICAQTDPETQTQTHTVTETQTQSQSHTHTYIHRYRQAQRHKVTQTHTHSDTSQCLESDKNSDIWTTLQPGHRTKGFGSCRQLQSMQGRWTLATISAKTPKELDSGQWGQIPKSEPVCAAAMAPSQGVP
jgi:hypothetical protein